MAAAAYAAGITQDEFDSTPIDDLMSKRILPALQSDRTEREFERIWISVTGGPRPFDDAGFRRKELADLDLGRRYIGEGLVDNRTRLYDLGNDPPMSNTDFNRRVVRIAPGKGRELAGTSDELTGDLKIPLVTLRTTGDGLVPLGEEQVIAARVAVAGAENLFVERTVQASGHCELTSAEMEAAFDSLVNWVQTGNRPVGESVSPPGPNLGARFTSAPRIGSPAASALPHAAERMEVKFNVTIDGNSSEPATLVLLVANGGLLTPCNYTSNGTPVDGVHEGVYDWWVGPASEVVGCGSPGSQIYALTYTNSHFSLSTNSIPWSPGPATNVVTMSFSSESTLHVAEFSGEVFEMSGHDALPGVQVQAFIGDALCGQTSVAPIARPSSVYWLLVVLSEAVPGCGSHSGIALAVDGHTTAGPFPSVVNDGTYLVYDLQER